LSVYESCSTLVKPRVEQFSAEGDATRPSSARGAPRHDAEGLPQETWMLQFLDDLLAVLHLQAKEIERLPAHVEQHTDRLLEESKMSLVVSELSALHADVKDRQ
jgi:hypothetical protein